MKNFSVRKKSYFRIISVNTHKNIRPRSILFAKIFLASSRELYFNVYVKQIEFSIEGNAVETKRFSLAPSFTVFVSLFYRGKRNWNARRVTSSWNSFLWQRKK